MLRPKALDHVALLVTDMDRTLRFYVDALGLKLLRRSGPNAEGVVSAVIAVGSQELNLFHRPGYLPVDRENSPGMHHFCLNMEADSIEDVMAGLRQAGIDNFRGPVERLSGVSVFVDDPDGVHVELRLPST
jgi:catechol 2,3-dioxygenase-like lactoylglutathione lyase family enzyme